MHWKLRDSDARGSRSCLENLDSY